METAAAGQPRLRGLLFVARRLGALGAHLAGSTCSDAARTSAQKNQYASAGRSGTLPARSMTTPSPCSRSGRPGGRSNCRRFSPGVHAGSLADYTGLFERIDLGTVNADQAARIFCLDGSATRLRLPALRGSVDPLAPRHQADPLSFPRPMVLNDFRGARRHLRRLHHRDQLHRRRASDPGTEPRACERSAPSCSAPARKILQHLRHRGRSADDSGGALADCGDELGAVDMGQSHPHQFTWTIKGPCGRLEPRQSWRPGSRTSSRSTSRACGSGTRSTRRTTAVQRVAGRRGRLRPQRHRLRRPRRDVPGPVRGRQPGSGTGPRCAASARPLHGGGAVRLEEQPSC